MNNSLFSKYIKKDTIIHNLDPRTKLVFTFTYLVLVFLANNIMKLIVLLLLLFFIEYLSKINFKYFISGLKSVLLLIMFTSLVHVFFNKNGQELINILGFTLYSGAINSIILIVFRFFLVVSLMIIFTITTSPNELTSSLSTKIGKENKYGLKLDTFLLLVSISLRFIPTIGEETNRIINAQISRGANLKTGGIISQLKNFLPILIPIFISTLKRAEELATAMEVRGYNPEKNRTKYKVFEYKKQDYGVYFLTILLIIFIVL